MDKKKWIEWTGENDFKPNCDNVNYVDWQEHPRHSIDELVRYCRGLGDSILNQDKICDTDRYVLGCIIADLAYNLKDINDVACEFERYTKKKMGGDWYEQAVRDFCLEKINEFAARVGEPDMFRKSERSGAK